MKQRFSFGLLAALLMVILVVSLLPAPTPADMGRDSPPVAVTASGTPTQFPAPTSTPKPFVPFPTRPVVSQSPTSIPRKATYTSAPAETPAVVGTPTLLPVFTETLVFFATMTATPFGGTATPPIPIAYSADGKPAPCYKGPSLAYIEIDTFEIARIVGKDTPGKWWYLLVNKGQGLFINCWVSGERVTTGGNLSGVLVSEPELPQITQITIDAPGPPHSPHFWGSKWGDARGASAGYVETIACGAGSATLHFAGHIFTNGPIDSVGYIWGTDAPVHFQPGQTPVQAWNTPAQVDVDLPVPAQAGSYFLRLRTTFPMEALGEIQITVGCK